MRSDMAKVIVERPRWGRDHARALKGRRERDPARKRGPKCDHPVKGLNENLAPLRRYLQRQVGRPWDDVYSDISRCLRPSNAVQQHVRDHLHDFVAQQVTFEGGIPYRFPGTSWGWREVRDFFVCPRCGVLCEKLSARRRPPDGPVRLRGCPCVAACGQSPPT